MSLKTAVTTLFEQAEETIRQRHADDIPADTLSDYLLLDVREDTEYAKGHLAGAVSMPRSRLEMECADCAPLNQNPERPVLVYCKSGRRSLLAAMTLSELGVENPISMKGGFTAWADTGKPVENESVF